MSQNVNGLIDFFSFFCEIYTNKGIFKIFFMLSNSSRSNVGVPDGAKHRVTSHSALSSALFYDHFTCKHSACDLTDAHDIHQVRAANARTPHIYNWSLTPSPPLPYSSPFQLWMKRSPSPSETVECKECFSRPKLSASTRSSPSTGPHPIPVSSQSSA